MMGVRTPAILGCNGGVKISISKADYIHLGSGKDNNRNLAILAGGYLCSSLLINTSGGKGNSQTFFTIVP